MVRAEVLLAIGLPEAALILLQEAAAVERASSRFRALRVRLLAADSQWLQGRAEAARIKPSDPLLLRRAGGRFFLASMREEMQRGDLAKAQSCCTQAKKLWPEGNVDHLSWGLNPPVPADLPQAEPARQIGRLHRAEGKWPVLPAYPAFQSVQTPLLRFQSTAARRSTTSQLRDWARQWPERWQNIKLRLESEYAILQTWSRLVLERIAPLWPMVRARVLGAGSPGTMVPPPFTKSASKLPQTTLDAR